MPPPLENPHYRPNQPGTWPQVNPSNWPNLPHPDGRVAPYYPNPEFERYPQPTHPFPYQKHFPVATPLGPHVLNHRDFDPGIDDPAPRLPQNNPAIPDWVEQNNPEYFNPQWYGPYKAGPGTPQDKYGRPPWMGGALPGFEHPGWEEHSPWGKGGFRFGQYYPWAKGEVKHTPKNPDPIKWINTDPGPVRKRLPNKDPLEGALVGGER